MHNDTITPKKALHRLLEGNKRFAKGKAKHPRAGDKRRKKLRTCQRPFATIVVCSDSRVPPEILFDCGLGDLFVIRLAGNLVDDTTLGSVLYAVEHLGCPLVMVLAHESCGAVTTALDATIAPADEPPALGALVTAIRLNIPESLAMENHHEGKLDAGIRENAAASLKRLAADPIVGERVGAGELQVVCAYYSLKTGVVKLF